MQSSLSHTNTGAIGSMKKTNQDGLAEADPEHNTMISDGLMFEFLTFTKLDEHRDKNIRRNIRSHVQRNYLAKKRVLSKERPSAIGLLAPVTIRQTSSLRSVSSPVTYLAAGQDPFSSLPMHLSEMDRICLHRFHQFAYDVDTANPLGRLCTIQSTYLPPAIKDPILLNGLLRCGATCLALSDPENRKLKQQAILYKGKMIEAINEALTDEQKLMSDSVIAGLAALQAHEYMDCNPNEYHLHAKALYHLVKLRGGLEKLGMKGYTAWTILRIDIGAASLFGSRPYYNQKARQKTVVSIGSLNPGFFPQSILSNLSEELIGTLDDICAMSSTTNCVKGIFHWDKIQDYHDRLMLIIGQRRRVDPLLELPDITLCTGLAAQIFFLVIVADLPIHAFAASHSSMELFEAVSRLLAEEMDGVLTLLFWAAFMGSLAVDSPEHVRQWSKVIASMTGSLGIATWEEAMSILKTFLWLAPRSEELGKATWLCVEALRII